MVVLAAAAWLAYTQWWGGGQSHELRWRDLTPALGRVEFTRRVTAVYHSRAPLERLLDATMPGRAPKPPRVDWRHEQVVVIAIGPRSSSGYSLEIQRIVERRRGVHVYVREQTPSLGDPVDPRVTYPYRALALRSSTKPVYVKLQGRP
ncbi:MAG TPA: protease complex subunit PrcB family protein [Gaiellaceae bacterium]|nr:protease complex subunit PrcB family protein [Gaiellaceae bacterium]